MEDFKFTLETAHPKAKQLMNEGFFWSPIEESGPFGSDDGWEAAYGFSQWRATHQTANPLNFLKQLITEWQYPPFDWNELDTVIINEYIHSRAALDESIIQAQIQELKESLKNSADSVMRNTPDEQLRETIISTSQQMGGRYLLGIDNAIIGTAFAQLALEGKISADIRSLAIVALKRQLLPLLIDRYDDKARELRMGQLRKMLHVVEKTAS